MYIHSRTVSKAELELLRKRFDVLGPDEDGLIDRSVFQTEPYDSDPFCKQVRMDRSLIASVIGQGRHSPFL